MIAATFVVVDGFKPIEKELIPIPQIQKRALMHIELHACLWPNRSSGVSVIPHQANESPEIWDNDVRYVEIIVDERCRTSEPKITSVVNKIVVQRLSDSGAANQALNSNRSSDLHSDFHCRNLEHERAS